jgi:chemotaxis protein MotA
MSRYSTLIGLLFGLLAIVGTYYVEGGNFASLFNLPSIVIVLGGTIAAGIIGSSLKQIMQIPSLISITLNPPKYDFPQVIEQLVALTVIARKDGLLALEAHLPNIEHPFLRKLLQLTVDGVSSDELNQLSETEIGFISERHEKNIQMFRKLGGYSPTMGVLGTVMGLISALSNISGDPDSLIRHIGTAFITTLWGVLLANILWLPIADKLRNIHDQEMALFVIFNEGVNSIQSGSTPSTVRLRLGGTMKLSEQSELLKKPIPRSMPSTIAQSRPQASPPAQ